jgi:hypothetical protein
MAFALRRDFDRSSIEPSRSSAPVCRVHSCRRCGSGISSGEPCSFVASIASVCRPCRGQEAVLTHLPVSRTIWGASLARARRA